jgi:hypothetical protein
MHTLFNLEPRAQQGIQHPTLWPYVKRGLQANLGQVVRYYRANPQAVKSEHLLVKLIQNLGVSTSVDFERYYAIADDVSLDLASVLKLTSALAKGQVFNGVFYGPGSQEIIIAHNDSFDLDKARKDWQNVTPVRVLRHAKSDLNLNLPDGIRNTTETGIAVIAINIPLLMVQYYCFRQSYWISDDQPQAHNDKTDQMFVHMYVLPNMLFSHLDQALFNRLVNLSQGKNEPIGVRRQPFALIDYIPKVNAVYKEVLTNLAHQEKNLVGILQSVPAATRENMEQAMRVPDVAPTRQVMWGLAIARLPMLDFILSQAHVTPATKNQAEVNNLNRMFERWRYSRIFEGHMPADMQADVIQDIEAILRKANPSQNDLGVRSSAYLF